MSSPQITRMFGRLGLGFSLLVAIVCSLWSMHSHHAAEPEVTRGRVDGLCNARSGSEPVAIARGAQVRAALHHATRDLQRGGLWVVAVLERSTARVGDRAARDRDVAVAAIPVDGPLPHVAGHVVEAEPVGRERAD